MTLQDAIGSSYTVERELGRGGMATVYLARDTKHGRQVALKVLHPELAASLGPERFRREIGFAATLQHPHILSVLDSGETADGHLWFTMPFVEGESLRDRLSHQRQLGIDEAIRITREIALALDFAHKRGVVHRDVKPENILLMTDGQALLLDFGIARGLASGSSDTTLTATGMVVGTAAYMSPEQASGDPTVGAASDIYSLGVVAYEMLAGEPPFTGPTVQAVIAKMMSTTEPPSVRRARPSVPEGVDAALRRALAPVPADRWPTAGELAKAMEAGGRATTAPVGAKRRVPVAVLALALGFLVGAGMLFAWRSKIGDGATASGSTRIAVLPFDNLGDSGDAYFADGVTDAVRGKLTALPGLEVIGSTSSRQYRGSTKAPHQIAQELGVRYLLIGKVRWAKGPGGASRVQVSPELVDAATSADKWGEPFDAPMTDVFQVQADIAGKVAQALRVALTSSDVQTLAVQPTANTDAYQAFLRGQSMLQSGNSGVMVHSAAGAFRDAVARDSMFAVAWASLGVAYSLLYTNSTATPAIADSADRATARALALAPELAEAHMARASFASFVLGDPAQAIKESEVAVARAPRNADALRAAAARETSAGRLADALTYAERSARLDPQSAQVAATLCDVRLLQRQYTDAREPCGRAAALRPGNLGYRSFLVMLAIDGGDLAGARSVMHAAPTTVDRDALLAYFTEYNDLAWVLDSGERSRVLELGPDAFDDSKSVWAAVRTQIYWMRGDTARARVYADSGRLAFERQVRDAPRDDQGYVFLGLMLAYLGKPTDAIRAAEHGRGLVSAERIPLTASYEEKIVAWVYVLTGQQEKAIDALEQALKLPGYQSAAWLRIDPTWAPLRANPRFQRLVGQAI